MSELNGEGLKSAAYFDYETLDPDARAIVKNRTAEIHSLVRMTATTVLKIGCKLNEVRPLLAARFVNWPGREFSWSERTAYNFIAVYKQFGDEPSAPNFAPSALYLLSAPSVPDEARKAAIRMAAAGETVTHKKARKVILHSLGRSDDGVREARSKSFTATIADEPAIKDCPSLFYVNRLTQAILNGNLNLKEDRLTYALHSLAELIERHVPLHPPK